MLPAMYSTQCRLGGGVGGEGGECVDGVVTSASFAGICTLPLGSELSHRAVQLP